MSNPSRTSRAVCLPRFGDSSVLTIISRDIPQLKTGEFLVRVSAASVNVVDYNIRSGKFPYVTENNLPMFLGNDLAGTVEEVGPESSETLRVGSKVIGLIGKQGAQSQYVVATAEELVIAPKSISAIKAAAVPLAALTAWQALVDVGGLIAGQRVLIHGGAGGVGHMAIQIAKAKEAVVFTTCLGKDISLVRELGADVAIDIEKERFEDTAKDVDLVIDLIGGATQNRSYAVLKEGGILVATAFPPKQEMAAAHKVRAAIFMAKPNAAQLSEIVALIDAGKLKIIVADTFPIDKVGAAHDRLQQGVSGKVVLTLD